MPETATTAVDELAIADTIDLMLQWARRRSPTHLSATSITTLDTLNLTGPRRISDLAVSEGVSQPAMTTLVNRLVADGMAAKVADPTDGRATLVRITQAGRRVLSERHAQRTAAIQADLQRLSPQHRRALAEALDALRELCRTPSKGSDS
ncbi:MAG TPA: MarR family transcriptional regulator [Jatrophihabitans sp.]|nr:MarR family transcriptional regulator [Jatrophihabitans sp.]